MRRKYLIVFAASLLVMACCAIAWGGSIVAWGANDWGQCDVPSPNSGFVAVASGRDHSVGLRSDGSLAVWGGDGRERQIFTPNSGYVAIAAGDSHTLALTDDGFILAWGDNTNHQCDVPSPENGFVAMAAGSDHSLGLRTDGSIAAWGWNGRGQCTVPLPNSGFTAVAAGEDNSLGLRSDGSIAAWGDNTYHQCDVPSPNTGFVAVAAGSMHSLGLRSDGSIAAWGDNSVHQCDVPSPNAGFVSIASFGVWNLALRSDGSVAAWGSEDSGQTGPPAPNSGFVALAVGSYHSLGIRSTEKCSLRVNLEPAEAASAGVRWRRVGTTVWHGSGDTETGISEGSYRVEFKCAAAWADPQVVVVLVAAGQPNEVTVTCSQETLVAWGQSNLGQCDVPSTLDCTAIAAGYSHSFALMSDGSLFGWGQNNYHQLEAPYDQQFSGIASGRFFSLGLKTDGTIVGWGQNTYGQCTAPEPNANFRAVAAAGFISAAIKTDGSVVVWGQSLAGTSSVPEPNTGFVSVAIGGSHIVGLKSDGSVVAWGSNSTGQCVVPSPNAGFVSVGAAGNVSFGVRSDGTIVPWGSGVAAAIPTPNEGFVSVSGYGNLVAGLRSDGSIVTWGSGSYGTLTVPSPNAGFAAVSVGNMFVVALRPSTNAAPGSLHVTLGPAQAAAAGVQWRRYGSGSWRNSGETEAGIPAGKYILEFKDLSGWTKPASRIVTITAGSTTEVSETYLGYGMVEVLIQPDLVWDCGGEWRWVGTTEWKMGLGGTQVRVPVGDYVMEFKKVPGWREPKPRAVTIRVGESIRIYATYHGGSLVAWGWNDDGQCNVPSPNSEFVSVATGNRNSFGVKSDGSIVAWGKNENGQFSIPSPNSDFVGIAAGCSNCIGLKSTGSLVAWGDNRFGQCNIPSPNAGFVSVAVGDYHSVGVRSDGSVAAWGLNTNGQCNVPSPNSGFVAVAAGFYHSYGLKSDGSIVAWGDNQYGQCNVPAPNTGFVSIGSGGRHSMAVRSDGSVAAWGLNDSGQCNVPTPNTGFAAVLGGGYFSLALKSDGSIATWGSNGYNQCNVPAPNTGFVDARSCTYHCVGLRFADAGSLRVTIQPAEAVAAGAKWRLVGSSWWRDSGDVEYDLPVGEHSVEFSDMSGWVKPAVQTVVVAADQTAEVTGTYVLTGSLMVTIQPAEAVGLGGMWRRVGTVDWLSSGQTESELAPGDYQIEFSRVPGWGMPKTRTLTVRSGQTVQTTGTYHDSNMGYTIAGSNWDFSFTQGYKGWYYGYWPIGTSFRQFTQTGYDSNPSRGAIWYGGTYCRLWDDGGHPDASSFAVRRWISSIDSEAKVTGGFWRLDGSGAGNGIGCSVNVNSSVLFSRTISQYDFNPATFDLGTHLSPGTTIDFVIGANGDVTSDGTGSCGYIHIPVATGSVRVTIQPAEAVSAGAKWRRWGTTQWYGSGETEYDVATDHHSIEFSTVPGWEAPSAVVSVAAADQLVECSVTYGPTHTISEAKASPDGTLVGVAEGIASASWDGVFYVQTQSRSAGIRVQQTGYYYDGQRATVVGTVGTTADGERFIQAAHVTSTASASAKPLAMPNRSIGGGSAIDHVIGLGQQGVKDGLGLNNIGLLVKTWGKVVEIEPVTAPATPKWFKVDDGSGTAVKCVVPSYIVVDPKWGYVSVTGVSSCEKIGGELHPLVRVRYFSDIVPR